ncbi:hypothetical protein F4824DRAFT_481277 [Ustulina deusta]|nr:hypothetical protein F4824DRAFT_481277 [Ustulina deusta]
MCWSGTAFNACYECAREFNHRAHVVPCHAAENGRPCAPKRLDYDVIHSGDNCAECKAARAAEEECQRLIYRTRPLNLRVQGKERMSALAAAYRQDLRARRYRREQLARDIAASRDLADGGGLRQTGYRGAVDRDGASSEGVVIAPMLVTARHQRNAFYGG